MILLHGAATKTRESMPDGIALQMTTTSSTAAAEAPKIIKGSKKPPPLLDTLDSLPCGPLPTPLWVRLRTSQRCTQSNVS